MNDNEPRRRGRSYTTPFKARFPAAWAMLGNGVNMANIPVKDRYNYKDGVYQPSYANFPPQVVERLADVCLHLMDCYEEGGSHHDRKDALEHYIRAQAAAISWLSR